ncbi:hypothetical protein [Corynebacterium mayonis]|uniref:hypothetical protein n=1 Tax=Corynebacterium mayonis TaxID=3062461 RepID=UPI003140A338
MNIPIPQDPRKAQVDAAAVTEEVNAVLSAPSGSLREEAELLRRAHEVLHRALHGDE